MKEQKRPDVARMVLFKNGVAYVERRGPASGSFDLRFQRDEMNDVLKSLAVWVAEGQGQVKSLGFDAPGDATNRNILLKEGDALNSLLASLRGRRVEVEAGGQAIQGEVLGVQQRTGPFGEQRAQLVLRADSGSVLVLELQAVRALRLLEGASRERLDLIVARDQAITAGEARSVHVELEGDAKDLRAAYVIPAPAWRVTYRVVREKGMAALMAIGIVFNPTDEDLRDVDLTLTTGQPVSFVMDLYHPREIRRPVVEEEARVSGPPTRHERAHALEAAPPPGGAARKARRGGEALSFGAADMEGAAEEAGEAATAIEVAEGVERGELFEYHVKAPISIKRGGAAMVPLAATRVDAATERLWRQGMKSHPDVVVSFKNETGLLLEEGPAVIYEEGSYAGESILPYSPRGASVMMTFAKDLAMRVKSATEVRLIVAAVRLVEEGLLEETRREHEHTISAESDHDAAEALIIEMPKITGRALGERSAQPFEETENQRRFRVEVPAHGKAELKVIEVEALSRRVTMESLDEQELQRWFKDRHLDEATYRALAKVIELREQAKELARQRDRAAQEQAAAYAKQAKISDQLAVLKETGPEGELRLRYVKELAAEQDKVNAAEAEIRRLDAEIEDARRKAREALAELLQAHRR